MARTCAASTTSGGSKRMVLPRVTLISRPWAEGKLVKLLAAYQSPSRPLHLLYGQDRYRSPKLRGFVEYLVGVLGK